MDFQSYWRFMNWAAFILLLVLGCFFLTVGEFRAAALMLVIAPFNYWMTRILRDK